MRLSNSVRTMLAAAVAVAFIQPGFAQTTGKPVTIPIVEQNGSGESGTATLTSVDGGSTKVEISMKGESKGAQPAHIHEGGCANLDPKPKQGLDNVLNGKSTTVVPVALSELVDKKLAINVHKSTDDIKTYVACGDITSSK